MKIAISNNRAELGKIDQGDKDTWRIFNGSFQNVDIEPEKLLELIKQGYAYTAQHRNYRKADNFIQAQHVGLDYDTKDERSRIDTLLTDPFIKNHAAFIHTTPSHTEAEPRARVVFVLDRPVKSAEKYALLTQAAVYRYQLADRACKDPGRFFYGAKGCQSAWLGNILTLETAAAELVQPYKEHLARLEKLASERLAEREIVSANDAPAALLQAHSDSLLDRVRNAPDGEKYVTLRDISITFGGYIAGGYYNHYDVVSWLQAAIGSNPHDVQDIRLAHDCIADSLRYGMSSPLYFDNVARPVVEVDPPLTAVQSEQVRRIIDRAYWQGYHDAMTQAQRERWHRLGFNDSVIDAYGLGFVSRRIDQDTGEILNSNALTVPYRAKNGDVVNIEYQDENGTDYEYESVPLFYANIFGEDENGAVVLVDDSLTAISVYMNYGGAEWGSEAVTIAGLPMAQLSPASLQDLTGREILVVVSPDFNQTGRGLGILRGKARFLRLPHTVEGMVKYGMTATDFSWLLKQSRVVG